eukprot:CAMPEP_0194333112 /NCGR_PEP_ID=MMETSP0171-20130528/61590_1 /TAXON_ID=218684 /ORGANISM="Corethron pennatum, Strain L29A3" /LENGTH=40 /DNA_ID= /DNA_START= /DNA_END= /DNA_ORIENTATION=
MLVRLRQTPVFWGKEDDGYWILARLLAIVVREGAGTMQST